MIVRPIRNDQDHAAALLRIEQLLQAPEGSDERDELDALAILVDAYEDSQEADPGMIEATKTRRSTTPGEILNELYLAPRNISISEFADACGVTRKHMSNIIHGHAVIDAEMAARIAGALGTTAQYWLQNALGCER